MSANREHNDDTAPTGAEALASPPPASAEPRNAGRRRALRVGLGAAPVILTLSSKPAFAQVLDRSAIESMSTCASLDLGNCGNVDTSSVTTLRSYYAPSPNLQDDNGDSSGRGRGNGNRNRNGNDRNGGSGRFTTVGSDPLESDTFLDSYSGPRFSSIFGTTWGPESGPAMWVGEERFGDVLWMDETRDPQNFGKLLVAAYLNASAGKYTMDVMQVVTMGQRALAGLPFYLSEGSSISWDQDQVIKYLTNTIPL